MSLEGARSSDRLDVALGDAAAALGGGEETVS